MTNLMIASQIGLWILVGFLVVAVFGLARQIGLLHRRVPASGARMTSQGPAIGDPAPALDMADVNGIAVTLGAVRSRETLLIFISPTCAACAELLPAVHTVARGEAHRLEIVLVSIGRDDQANREYAATASDGLPLVAQPSVSEAYFVLSAPYAVLVGADGVVRARGMVNHLEHLESLLNASTAGHPTLESYMAARLAADVGTGDTSNAMSSL